MKIKNKSFICIGAVHKDTTLIIKKNYYFKRTNPVLQKKSIGGVAYNIASKIAILNQKIELISLNCIDEIKKEIKKRNIKFRALNILIKNRSYTTILNNKRQMIFGLANMEAYEKRIRILKIKLYIKKIIIIDLNLSSKNIQELINKFYKNNFISICGTSSHKVYKITNQLNKIHILILNKQESLNLTNKKNILDALKYLISKNNKLTILITNGKNKVVGYHKNYIYSCLPPKIKIKNENGAGDTMSAIFIYFYFKLISFKETLSKSIAAGSLHAKGYNIENKNKYIQKINNISKTLTVKLTKYDG